MPDPNVTDPVVFNDTYGNRIRISGDYGRVVLDGRAELGGGRLLEFLSLAAATYLEARDREVARLAEEAAETRLPDACQWHGGEGASGPWCESCRDEDETQSRTGP